MSVTHLTDAADPTDALVGRIVAEIRSAIAKPDLSAVHEAIREAGIRNARRALADAPERLSEAQAAYREAQALEAVAREAHNGAMLEADWTLDGQIHSESNKRYRWVPCECLKDADFTQVAGMPDCPVCKGDGKYRRFMLADDVKAWKAGEVAKLPAVVAVAAELRRAEENTAAARDAIAIAERRFSALKADLAASVAELNALAVGLQAAM